MHSTRHIEPMLRRARLLAACTLPFWAIPRAVILAGYYDGGSKVRDKLNTDEARQWAASRGLTEE